MKSLRKCVLTFSLCLSIGAATATATATAGIIKQRDLTGPITVNSLDGWNMVGNLDHVFDGTTHTGVDFERGQRCSARWFGYCMGSEATGAELDSETHFSFAGELDKIWDITGVAVFGHNITGVQLEFFDMDQVSISRTDQVWHNAASFVINVTDSANSWYSDSDGDFRLKEIELHGTHSLLQRDSKPVDVNAPATLGLLSLAGLLLLRRRV